MIQLHKHERINYDLLPNFHEFVAKNIVGTPFKELIAKVNQEYDIDFGLRRLKSYCGKHRLKNGITSSTTFYKGQTSWTEGRKWNDYMSKQGQANSRKTCFQKGSIPHNAMPIGYESIDCYGYAKIKVPEYRKLQYKHRYIYEQAYGKITGNDKIIFLDGDKTNITLENLAKVTSGELLIINNHKLIYSNPELSKCGVNIAKIQSEIGKRRKHEKQTD